MLTVKELVNELQLEVVSGDNYLEREIKSSEISRPGLELTGYFSYYAHDRIQLFGKKESTFSDQMTSEERYIIFKRLCGEETPVFVFARDLTVPEELSKVATDKHIPILRSPIPTSRISGVISNFVESKLAERTTIHGVLVEVYGLGVLIQGQSGIGKSETALELIKKGHRLIADDRVDIYQQDERTIIGEPPKILEHLMEIRGIGIIDVMNLFGASSVRNHAHISLVANLENWTQDNSFDRLGSEPETILLANVPVPKISIPVSTGRNVSIMIEVAAMNFRAKSLGYDASKKFEENLTRLIEENSNETK
ncbi:HPr(Ser) kinase/phosphatase [Vagococcus acidifermentans]|uniref:HPr kinase/phosphorylase n=1 Tax=Vagococcus acidifermentans TaxID=564710 RepID=A0A430ATR5_9ENTE|nr:HPr(Ser) kinase/phosphatase [Vagococcus acidifermentans]RSU11452.1 HPr kinase/phosphorylase [Vagococcus acidifermentans]